jgi:hypothetical protein
MRVKLCLQHAFEVEVFAGNKDTNSDGARNCVNWMDGDKGWVISLHLDSATGNRAALLCYQEEHSLSSGLSVLATYCRQMDYANKGAQNRVPGQRRYIPTGDGIGVLSIPESNGIKAMLIEMGDMNSPDGENWVTTQHQDKAAKALAVAILSTFGGKIEEEDMAIVTSGQPVKLFSTTINPIDGDAWTKVYNPNQTLANVKVSFSTSKAMSFTIKPNEVAALSAKNHGATGETQIAVTSDIPVVVTVKQ